ncbi:putative M1 family aminopeptidase [Trichinella pseudospiralis]
MTDCMALIHQLQVYNRWLCLGHDSNGQTGAGKRAESLCWKRLSLFYKVDSHVQLFVDALDRWLATVHHGGNSLEAAVWRRQVAWRRWNAPFQRPTPICLKKKIKTVRAGRVSRIGCFFCIQLRNLNC